MEDVIYLRNFRVGDFCRAYRIGRRKVYLEIQSGRLKTFKVGKITLISREAAEQWQAGYEASDPGRNP